MKIAFDRKTALGFGFALVVLTIASMFSYHSIITVSQSSDLRAKSRQNLLAIDAVFELMQDAETGQRGFLLTRKEQFLKPYSDAVVRIDAEMERLELALSDVGDQKIRLKVLKGQIKDKLAVLAETVDLAKAGNFDKASMIVATGRDKAVMDEIRKSIADIQQSESALLVRRTAETDRAFEQGSRSVLLSCLLAIVFVGIAGVFLNQDILQRLAAEAERDRFFTVSLDLLCVAGMDGYFKRMNPSFEQVLGFTPAELCTKPFLEFVHPDDIASTMKEVEKLSSGVPTIFFENRYLCKDGSYKWLSWKTTPMDGLLYAGARDITDMKKVQQQLIAARQAALDTTRMKSEFLANMSHEIRTPMNGVIGMTDLLLETELDEQQTKYARIIQESGSGLLNIINDILDFSKIEAGRMELEIIDFDLVAVIEGQADLMTRRAMDKGLSLMTIIDPAIPKMLKGDPGRVSQILLNLVTNAIKFTESGSIVVRATCESTGEEDGKSVNVRFTVQDTGIGLSKSETSKLFQPFTQADGSTARKYGGTGLGLSICKRLVELMGGMIGVDSKVGEGSTFWFTTRLARSQAAAPTLPASIVANLEKLKVLIVDDDPPAGEIIATYLKNWKMNPATTMTGEEALVLLKSEAAKHDPYTVVIMDRRLPGMDGFELAEKMRGDSNLMSSKLILITAYDRSSQAEAARKLGFSAYLTKPLKQSELYNALIMAVQASSLEKASKRTQSTVKPKSFDAPGAGVRILVAEDNSVNQMLILAQLKGLGYAAHSVANGKEVLAALKESNYDLVLMDCQMPEMDGFDATRAIRDLEKTSGHHIPIVALTANAMSEDRDRCLKSGMDDYLSKPTKKELLSKVLIKWTSGTHQRKVS